MTAPRVGNRCPYNTTRKAPAHHRRPATSPSSMAQQRAPWGTLVSTRKTGQAQRVGASSWGQDSDPQAGTASCSPAGQPRCKMVRVCVTILCRSWPAYSIEHIGLRQASLPRQLPSPHRCMEGACVSHGTNPSTAANVKHPEAGPAQPQAEHQ